MGLRVKNSSGRVKCMRKKYVIGLDFGSLSARGVLVALNNGKILTEAVTAYKRGILSATDVGSKELPPDTVLVDALDYWYALRQLTGKLIEQSGVDPKEIGAMGIDFTASTVLPVDRNLIPLSEKAEYRWHFHAYTKLWKHHSASPWAEQLTELLKKYDRELLAVYGNRISAECLIPKVLEIFEKDRKVYDGAAYFLEAADWLLCKLTGKQIRSASFALCKGLWREKQGYPEAGLFAEIAPELENIPEQKLGAKNALYIYPWEKAGTLTEEAAEELKLCADTIVTGAQMDAHAGLPALGITDAGKVLLVVGTSTGIIFQGKSRKEIQGLCSIADYCDLPELIGYAAGQASTGDCLEWFIKNSVPGYCQEQAREAGKDIFSWLSEQAEKLKPGQNGLLALDWWNGNRSCLADQELSGLILGLGLETRPEEIYRALLEACAFGVKRIFKEVEQYGIPLKEIHACGGITQKNPLFMQIYADVTGKKIIVHRCEQAPALGMAIYAAAALPSVKGGYGSGAEEGPQTEAVRHAALSAASANMQSRDFEVYTPQEEYHRVYESMGEEFDRLYDYFGMENHVMKKLKQRQW